MAPLATALLLAFATQATSTTTPPPRPDPLQVTLVADEAEAVLHILDRRARGTAVTPADWRRLFHAEGTRRLERREAAMHRTLSDSAMRAFVLSHALLTRRQALHRTLARWRQADLKEAARKALAYLPAGTVLRARMYLEIKPATNSFVFSGDGLPPGIFLYLNPSVSADQFANTVAHELHHIGYNAACHDPEGLAPPTLAAVRWLGGFGEGLAMLAAAGGPTVHPHAVSPDSIRRRWDRDVAGAGEAIPELERFFGRILDGRLAGDDSIARAAGPFYGVQGPFYTVGWLMWSAVERAFGRARVVALECDLRRFPATYNAAARKLNAAGEHLPLWSDSFVSRFGPP